MASDADPKTRRGLPVTIFVRRDRDHASGVESLSAAETIDAFEDGDRVGVYRRADVKTLRVTRTLQ